MKKLILLSLLTSVLAACGSGPATGSDPVDPALVSAKAVFEAKCSLCHGLDRALGVNKTAEGWSNTVLRMQRKAPDRISDADVKSILTYLNAVKGS